MTPRRAQSRLARSAIVLAALCQLAASFDVQTIPGTATNTTVFVAQAGAGAASGLFIVSGNTLIMVRGGGQEDTVTFSLENGTAAIDIADVDNDGTAEIYTVAGREIRRRSVNPEEDGSTSRVLFSRETLLSTSDGGPRPCVLITDWEGRPALALPEKDGLSVLSLDGTLLKHFPRETAYLHPATLRHTVVAPPQAGPPGTLELWADVLFDSPGPPGFGDTVKDPPPSYRRATYTQAHEASKLPPADWPWFLLAPAKSPGQRVMYAIAGSSQGNTLIRIRGPEPDGNSKTSAAFRYSPQRHYPGTLVSPAGTAPDFNADGYTDLLLWTSPRPGTSIDSLMRAARARTWPVRLTTHLFSRVKGIYSGSPAARIELLLPITWSLALDGGSPLRHMVLRDINGDGYTDIGLALGPTRFALWTYKIPGSFSAMPDYTADLPEAIQGIALVAEIGDAQTLLIALRGSKALYLLRLPESTS